MQGIWTNDLFEYHGEFADFERCGFGHKPLQAVPAEDLLQRASRTRAARRRVSRSTPVGPTGIQDSPDDIGRSRTEIQQELDKLDTLRSMDNVDMCSMIWFVITDDETDMSNKGKASNLLAAPPRRSPTSSRRYQEAGTTLPLRRRSGTSRTSKTMDDLCSKKRSCPRSTPVKWTTGTARSPHAGRAGPRAGMAPGRDQNFAVTLASPIFSPSLNSLCRRSCSAPRRRHR